ncbi:MAG: DEAD/DEAH box helicase [Deltaproteobacteria bacterium]|nr:DEAD/DEAH box helicase [Deltaproteobacteria bacterium]
MIVRPDGLNLRRSLRSALGDSNPAAVEQTAKRQERTIDAILRRLYDHDEECRREIVLLADEVGLGKTFVALGVAWSVLRRRSAAGLSAGPVLVVTPHAHALFKKWKRETERFLQLVVPTNMVIDVRTALTPHELAHTLQTRMPTLVIARMSAFSGRLHQLDVARMAAIHSLFHMDGFRLSMDERIEMLSADCPSHATREGLDLRRSRAAWEAAKSAEELGFDDNHIRAAWRRLGISDRALCDRLTDSWNSVKSGRPKQSSFWEDIRELCRTALGQTVPHNLPLVIVDEIHNWKNHPASWWRFLHTLGLRIDRLLGLSATPFQLGPHELTQVLELRRCIDLSPERSVFLDDRVSVLRKDLRQAESAGESLRSVWSEVEECDLSDLEQAWRTTGDHGRSDSLPPRLQRALRSLMEVRAAHIRLGRSLRPFLLRHRRDDSHRAWLVGREADPRSTASSARRGTLRWGPGLDVSGDGELVHYLMMRAVQEQKDGRGLTSLGADLGGSYAFFRDGELERMLQGHNERARHYLSLVERAVSGDSHEHPKVAVTAERAFRAWLKGDKTLVFCFNIATVGAVRAAVNSRIDAHNSEVLTAAFNCTKRDLELRLKNFQKRLYNYRQSVFLLFQDHPLAGPRGRVPHRLALRKRDVAKVALRLSRGGPPRDRSGRFDRRRVLAATEQFLVSRWKESEQGRQWLKRVLAPLRLAETTSEALTLVSSSDWPARRRELVEGVLRDAEIEALPDDEDIRTGGHHARTEEIAAWKDVLEGRAGQATLAPYLADVEMDLPSLLTRWHSAALAPLPVRLRALAARMLRRMIRSPGFLARFILDEPAARPDIDDDVADDDWTRLIHRRYQISPTGGESARERFEAYLETLQKAVDLEEQTDAYDEASRNRDVVTHVTGSVPNSERDRLFTGFNTPLVPEVLIVTTVGQEGIDLHRECRHVVHHDLPWNPATLEQRTGRIDRIGSKTERLRGRGKEDCYLDIAVPYIAGTYDEHRFRVVHGRHHIFDVTMGGEYAVDGHRIVAASTNAEGLGDDFGEQGAVWAPIPEAIAKNLRLHLGVGSRDGAEP